MEKYVKFLPDVTETIHLGVVLANVCQQACVIYIHGDLGTGKTTFCRGFLQALGYEGNVKSPTYTIVESYVLKRWTVYHFDLYRLTKAEELECIGVRDYFNGNALCLIEWPQYGTGILPMADIVLTLDYQGKGRKIEAKAFSIIGTRIIVNMSALYC